MPQLQGVGHGQAAAQLRRGLTGMLQWVVVFFCVAVVGTGLALRYAVWRNLFDHPGERRSHERSTARGGGAAIVAALLIATFVVAFRDPGEWMLLGAFGIGLALVAAVGLIDDHKPLSPWLRLAAHMAAALLMAVALLHVTGDWRVAAVAFVAITALTNVWNFMDGINGLAASQAIVVAGLLASGWIGSGTWTWMAAALVAACAGFLPYNFPKARIFLGDVGSGSIGYAIATMVVVLGAGHEKTSWLLLLPLSAFLVDAGLTLLRRVVRREAWWAPHTQHAYQIWARKVGHTRVTLAYAVWTLAGALLLLGIQGMPVGFTLACAVAWYISAGLAWWLLQCMESEKKNPHSING